MQWLGFLLKQGKLDILKPAGLEEWKDDERSKITLNDLMQMQSGLKWNEDYGNRSDVTLMLHCESDMGRYAYEQPMDILPGTQMVLFIGNNKYCQLSDPQTVRQ